MEKVNYYKESPTWLYKKGEDPKLFNTQEEVDSAWEDGWYGPQWLVTDKPLLADEDFSTVFATKQRLIDAAANDPRYGGVKLNKKRTVSELYDDLILFEVEAGLRGDDGDE